MGKSYFNGIRFGADRGPEWKAKMKREADAEKREAKLRRLKRKYGNPERRNWRVNWAVIQLYWRENLTVEECAEVLGISEESVEFEIDIAKQNAK